MSDFFSKIDSEIVKQKQAEQSRKVASGRNSEFFREAAARLAPILEQYAAKLKERGMNVTHSASDQYVWLELKYADGGHRSIAAHTNTDSGRIEFKEHFTDDDGKNYKSVTGQSYDQSTWSDGIFVSKLEGMIENFVIYAPRHGGF